MEPECIQHPLSSMSSDIEGSVKESTSKPVLKGENVTNNNSLVEIQLKKVQKSPNKLETDKTQQARDNSDVS